MNDGFETSRPPRGQTLVSVVMPVYNEAEVLPILTSRVAGVLEECQVAYELIFVNDGSTDQSGQTLDRLADDERIRVVHLSRNFGHQAAVQAGLNAARGDAVVLMDSDLQDAPEAIPRFLAEWQAGYDVVYALRTKRKENWLKRTMFAGFHRLMSAVAATPIPADAGIFGLVDRRVARQIAAMGENDRYFPGLRSWVGFRQKGIEVERNARYDDHPRVSFLGLVRLAKTAMFSFSSFPLAVFHVIGVAASLVFLGLGGFAVFCKLFTSWAIPGWTSYMLTGSFFGAINALGISILGEYVIRIYDQVRARPAYIVERRVNFPSPERWNHETGDEPYLDLMNEAMELLDEGDIAEHRWENAEEQAGDFEAADPEWLRAYR